MKTSGCMKNGVLVRCAKIQADRANGSGVIAFFVVKVKWPSKFRRPFPANVTAGWRQILVKCRREPSRLVRWIFLNSVDFCFFGFISEGWKFFFELGSPVWDYAMRHDGLQTSMTRKVIPWAWIYFSKSRNQNDSLFKSSSLNRQGHMTGKRASICWGRLASINSVMLPTEGSTIMSMVQQ